LILKQKEIEAREKLTDDVPTGAEEEVTLDIIKTTKKKEEDEVPTTTMKDDKNWLIAEELKNALDILIVSEQRTVIDGEVLSKQTLNDLDTFVDENGVIRCKGRMKEMNADFETKFPVLLTTSNELSRLLVLDAHEKVGFSGFRNTWTYLQNKYWIS